MSDRKNASLLSALLAAALSFGAVGARASNCPNGIYLDPKAWLQSDRTEADLTSLAERLARSSMGNVYFYANRLKNPDDAARFRELSAALKKRQPGLKLYGFIGIRVKDGNYPDPANQAKKLAALGFDGVQLDYEPTPKAGDPKYLASIDRARAAAPGLRLGVAASWLAPDATLGEGSRPRAPAGKSLLEWDAGFYSQILDRVDDVMVMDYDTNLRSPDGYAAFTGWQYDRLRSLAKGRRARVSIGLPTNVAGRSGLYDRKAENFRVGMAALRSPLAQGCPDGIGVTLYDETGMKDAEWASFRRLLEGGSEGDSERRDGVKKAGDSK